MYKIFLDQPKSFQCNIQIEGADLNKSEARLVIESENYNLQFSGKIDSNGIVKIPMGKLKGILKENYTGKIKLEIIAEDTLFIPWESEYRTDVYKKVQIEEIKENINETVYTKPKMSFSIIPDEFDTKIHVKAILEILNKHNVNKQNLIKNNNVFNRLIETYCNKNDINNINEISRLKKDLYSIIK